MIDSALYLTRLTINVLITHSLSFILLWKYFGPNSLVMTKVCSEEIYRSQHSCDNLSTEGYSLLIYY